VLGRHVKQVGRAKQVDTTRHTVVQFRVVCTVVRSGGEQYGCVRPGRREKTRPRLHRSLSRWNHRHCRGRHRSGRCRRQFRRRPCVL